MRSQTLIQAMLPSNTLVWHVIILTVFLLPEEKIRIGKKRVDVEIQCTKLAKKIYFFTLHEI